MLTSHAEGSLNQVFVSLYRHTVNLLVNLPLMCLDVLLTPKVEHGSVEYMGMNMDTVEVLIQFLDRRLDRVSVKKMEMAFSICNMLGM